MRYRRAAVGVLAGLAMLFPPVVRAAEPASGPRTASVAANALAGGATAQPQARESKDVHVPSSAASAGSEQTGTYNDTSEANLFYADLLQVGLTVGDGGVLSAFAEDYFYTNPATRTEWINYYTQIRWDLDTNNDLTSDVYVLFWNFNGSVRADLLRTSDNGMICTGTPSYYALSNLDGFYRATFPISCLSNPSKVNFYTRMLWDDAGTLWDEFDRVPNASNAWIGPVDNAAYTPPTGVKLQAGQVKEVKVTGANGIPEAVAGSGEATGVAAVSMNVTVTQPDGVGYITVYPCGTRPLASNVNYVAGQTVPNAVIAPVSANGTVCFYSSATTHILADVNGWFPINPAGFQSLTPKRVFDTRDGTGGVTPNQRLASDGTLTMQMTGANGVPANGVAAVSLNVTVTDPTAGGYITVYPCGNRPLASNLNYVAGQTVPNAVIAPVSADGKVCFYALGATHLLADVNGWFPVNAAGFQSLTPTRVFDTRDGTGGVTPNQRVASDGTLTVQMTGRNGVPANGVAAVVLNVTLTDPTAGGYITVYPCGTRPLASNLNYVAGQTVPNMVIAPVSADGKVCFYALGATHLLADVSGWFPVNPAGFQALTPYRLFDTRN